MARQGKVLFIFERRVCKEKIKFPLYFGIKKIWNNSLLDPVTKKPILFDKENLIVRQEGSRQVQRAVKFSIRPSSAPNDART